jgi:hypothetical protein
VVSKLAPITDVTIGTGAPGIHGRVSSPRQWAGGSLAGKESLPSPSTTSSRNFSGTVIRRSVVGSVSLTVALADTFKIIDPN